MQKLLFITGSINQTTQMHQIAGELQGFDCWFSQVFADSPLINFFLNRTKLLDGTVMSGQFRHNSEKYLKAHGLQIDYGAKLNTYDVVVYCTDMMVPVRMRKAKTIFVQEGMTDKKSVVSRIVKAINLPPFLSGNTSYNGATNICDVYCAASEGYKQLFTKNGTDEEKIIVTGIPNYDNLQQFRDNDFPYRGYVMVATTDMRETFRYENRPAFIRKAIKIANGRQLLFKLHPNENFEVAEKEIKKYAPKGTLIYRSGNTNQMIANCSELITQYSTVVYTGIALGKKVYSWFDLNELYRLLPIQNGGTSAKNIAEICRSYAIYKGDKKQFMRYYNRRKQAKEKMPLVVQPEFALI
jgi:hypothetical protein